MLALTPPAYEPPYVESYSASPGGACRLSEVPKADMRFPLASQLDIAPGPGAEAASTPTAAPTTLY